VPALRQICAHCHREAEERLRLPGALEVLRRSAPECTPRQMSTRQGFPLLLLKSGTASMKYYTDAVQAAARRSVQQDSASAYSGTTPGARSVLFLLLLLLAGVVGCTWEVNCCMLRMVNSCPRQSRISASSAANSSW
jgi:hypothetical protein